VYAFNSYSHTLNFIAIDLRTSVQDIQYYRVSFLAHCIVTDTHHKATLCSGLIRYGIQSPEGGSGTDLAEFVI